MSIKNSIKNNYSSCFKKNNNTSKNGITRLIFTLELNFV